MTRSFRIYARMQQTGDGELIGRAWFYFVHGIGDAL